MFDYLEKIRSGQVKTQEAAATTLKSPVITQEAAATTLKSPVITQEAAASTLESPVITQDYFAMFPEFPKVFTEEEIAVLNRETFAITQNTRPNRPLSRYEIEVIVFFFILNNHHLKIKYPEYN